MGLYGLGNVRVTSTEPYHHFGKFPKTEIGSAVRRGHTGGLQSRRPKLGHLPYRQYAFRVPLRSTRSKCHR
jgi:hypothetical protein